MGLYPLMIVYGRRCYSHFGSVFLDTLEPLKSDFFLEREKWASSMWEERNGIGRWGNLSLDYKEALYLGRGIKEVHFSSEDSNTPS